jgi:hypothetical protein
MPFSFSISMVRCLKPDPWLYRYFGQGRIKIGVLDRFYSGRAVRAIVGLMSPWSDRTYSCLFCTFSSSLFDSYTPCTRAAKNGAAQKTMASPRQCSEVTHQQHSTMSWENI